MSAATALFPDCRQVFGFDIDPSYVRVANRLDGAKVYCQDVFRKDWPNTLKSLEEPVLVIGNPPWVTNSEIGRLNGTNLPFKSNFKGVSGFEAITGKSNFDVSEWIIAHFLECLSGREAVLAMLCKTSVARRVLRQAWNRHLQIDEAKVLSIDASQYFGASVDACLLVVVLKRDRVSRECAVFGGLEENASMHSKFALRDGKLIAELEQFETYSRLSGIFPRKWRSGVKHDCSSVVELVPKKHGVLVNGFGELVTIEPTLLYPMLKSSDLHKKYPVPSRYMLVTQRTVREDTWRIRREAPRSWQYLESHRDSFDRRRSVIYKGRPSFSMFGIGSYSFAPWKVATSGLAKKLEFHCIGPHKGKPVVFDDTCYYIPCRDEAEARGITSALNSDEAKGFYGAQIFWDQKRPITAGLLATLDLRKLAAEAKLDDLTGWLDGQSSLL